MHEHLSSPLGHYFSKMLGAGAASSPTDHVALGADCVSQADLASLQVLLPEARLKASTLAASSRLRQRVEVLAGFVEETPAAARTVGQRESAFVLYYFLKGQDLIPDHIPEIGLLDDALLVETAFYRNLHELRSHWAAQGRPWPEKS